MKKRKDEKVDPDVGTGVSTHIYINLKCMPLSGVDGSPFFFFFLFLIVRAVMTFVELISRIGCSDITTNPIDP